MEPLVRFVAKAFVEEPGAIEIDVDETGMTLIVADDDLGRMIGRRGKTARALRTVLRAFDGPELEITSTSEVEDPAEDDSADGGSE